jgi:excisionase family DNA binding protein
MVENCYFLEVQKLQKSGTFSIMPKKCPEPRMVTHPLGTEIYSVRQVAESLGLSTKTIYEAIEAGKLQAKKTGKQFLITREAVREYWDSLPAARKEK